MDRDVGIDEAPGPQPYVLCRALEVAVAGRTIVRDLSLEVAPGEVVVIVGPSGVGKSVLADAIFGLHGPTIRVDGQTFGRERGALVLQRGGGLPHLSVAENLRLVAASPASARRALQSSGLRGSATMQELSGGEERRLATARALAAERDLLWLDEPAAGLDVARVRALAAELRRQADELGRAFVVAEHRPELIAACADRVLVLLGDGRYQWLDVDVHGETDALRHQLERLFDDHEPGTEQRRRRAIRWSNPLAFFAAFPLSLQILLALGSRQLRATLQALWKAFQLSALRGAPFQLLVAAIFALIFVLVFKLTLGFLDLGAVLSEFGPEVIVRVAPVLGAILAAAQAGSSVAAWLGQIVARREVQSLEVLGVSAQRALFVPAWWGLALGVVTSLLLFALGMYALFAGWLAFEGYEVGSVHAAMLQTDYLPAIGRALLYGALISSITVTRVRRVSGEDGAVAAAITATIVECTLWLMLSEAGIVALQLLRV